MTTQDTLFAMQLFLTFGNCCIMLFAFKTFLTKPHNSLEQRVTTVETEVKDIKESLHKGNERFQTQEESNEMFISCMLAFIDFEIAYCTHTGYDHSEDLTKAKEILQKYLAKRKL